MADSAAFIAKLAKIESVAVAVAQTDAHLASCDKREFFLSAFPPLLSLVFGFGTGSRPGGWLAAAVGRDRDAASLVALLSPGGRLMRAMHETDVEGIVRYRFPTDSLPSRTQALLAVGESRSAVLQHTLPHYRGRLAGDGTVQLPVVEYYLFWFAFYIHTSGGAGPRGPARRPPAPAGLLSTAASLLHVSGGRDGPAPYRTLVLLYLHHYVVCDASGAAAWSDVALAPIGSPTAAVPTTNIPLLSILLEFWACDALMGGDGMLGRPDGGVTVPPSGPMAIDRAYPPSVGEGNGGGVYGPPMGGRAPPSFGLFGPSTPPSVPASGMAAVSALYGPSSSIGMPLSTSPAPATRHVRPTLYTPPPAMSSMASPC